MIEKKDNAWMYLPHVCEKCGEEIKEKDKAVLVDYPGVVSFDWFLHSSCAQRIRQFCKDAQQGKRVRGW